MVTETLHTHEEGFDLVLAALSCKGSGLLASWYLRLLCHSYRRCAGPIYSSLDMGDLSEELGGRELVRRDMKVSAGMRSLGRLVQHYS